MTCAILVSQTDNFGEIFCSGIIWQRRGHGLDAIHDIGLCHTRLAGLGKRGPLWQYVRIKDSKFLPIPDQKLPDTTLGGAR